MKKILIDLAVFALIVYGAISLLGGRVHHFQSAHPVTRTHNPNITWLDVVFWVLGAFFLGVFAAEVERRRNKHISNKKGIKI